MSSILAEFSTMADEVRPPGHATFMIYLDHNATTPVPPEVWEAMEPFRDGLFANPSSSSVLAKPVKRMMTAARESCAALLGCLPEELIFTSGGTESLNAAIHSVLSRQADRRQVVVGCTEHEAVLNSLKAWERDKGYEVTRVPVNPDGRTELAAVAEAIRPGRTAAVVLMWANNETGVLQPVPEVASLAAAHGIPCITDAVQAAGKVPLDLSAAGVDFAAFSGHKFNAPKGIGLLYINRRTSYQPWFLGGSQENSRRAGTENTMGIAAIGAAARLAREGLNSGCGEMRKLRDRVESEAIRRIPGTRVNGAGTARVPNTASLRFQGTQAQGLLMLLDQRGVCVSAGSACTTGSLTPSHVLTAMGLSEGEARSTLRFSLGRSSSREEVDRALDLLEIAVEKFRSLMPGMI